jgi:hypothetical protein
MRHAAKWSVYAGSQEHSLLLSQCIIKEGGQAGSRRSCPSGPLIYLSTLPGQPCINPIYPHSQLLPIALPSCCYVIYEVRAAGSSPAAQRRPPREGRATSYRGGKQSYLLILKMLTELTCHRRLSVLFYRRLPVSIFSVKIPTLWAMIWVGFSKEVRNFKGAS